MIFLGMPLPLLVVLAVIGFTVLFTGIWCFVCFVLAHVGGWSALAARYRATTPPDGIRHSMVRGAVGAVEYNGALNVSVGAAGLHLSVFRLLKLAHPDLFIPWEAVTAREDRKLFLGENVRLSIGRPPLTTITLPKKTIEAGSYSITRP